MSPDDMKRQKADLLLEYQETEEKLAHLRLRATTLGDTLMTIAKWIGQSPEMSLYRPDQAHHGFNVQVTPQKYLEALEPTQYFKLADELRETEEHLDKLERHKLQLGLK